MNTPKLSKRLLAAVELHISSVEAEHNALTDRAESKAIDKQYLAIERIELLGFSKRRIIQQRKLDPKIKNFFNAKGYINY